MSKVTYMYNRLDQPMARGRTRIE